MKIIHTMRQLATGIFLLCGAVTSLWAQPSNDECASAVMITDVTNFCSPVAAYTNVNATPSLYSPPACFTASMKDVWFSFTAQFTDVTITIHGATSQDPGGTLRRPQFVLYGGTCGNTLDELECQSSAGLNNIVEGYQGGLFPGTTYYIRVQGANNESGTFQICINNYNPVATATSDCPSAAVLCDKSPFAVQSVEGAGFNITELNDASCFFNGQGTNYETNSTWYVWTCSQSGTLEFTLTPNNPSDDLDFVIYRLPNGVGNCSGKQVVRCMASGLSPNVNSAPCLGPTGLRAGDPDVSEDAGCGEAGDNAWLAPLDMMAGETYALCVNNFSTTRSGFSIEFGGSGQFLGPDADFNTIPAAVCLGTPVQMVDASTSPFGPISAWQWSFGADANPKTANTGGPHTVQFNQPGVHPVALTVTAKTPQGRECKITDFKNITVYPDVEVDTVIGVPDCNGGTNGSITITNIKMGTPAYLFSWNGGPFGTSNTLTGLSEGVYSLVIKDANECKTDLNINVQEKILRVNADVQKPLCFGDSNGQITLHVTNGTEPFKFNWGSGYENNANSKGGFKAGVYTILGQDAELCEGTFMVTVTDNPPLALSMDTTNISCFGANDGMSSANAAGGVEGFGYHWSDGQTTQTATGLEPGQYSVTVKDGNGCSIVGGVFITEPEDVGINLIDVVDLVCNGVPEGEIRVEGVGGVQPYKFSADGKIYVGTDTLTMLQAGDYWVKIRDANGCVDSLAATITQPPPLVVVASPADTTIDLGYNFSISTLTAPFGRPVNFQWAPPLGLSCVDCAEPEVTGISDQLYIIKITDETGCTAFDTVLVKVNKKRPVYFPNIFAPDRPYPNDHFTGFSGPAAELISLLRIYDRWGSLVYETKNIPLNEPNLGWNGLVKGQETTGVFTYYAIVRFVDQEELQYEGNVTVFK